MKVLFPFLLAVVIALPASAHPGKTDRQGGHKCYKECAEWDLYYAEYHLHDKDGKSVKVARKKTVRQKPASVTVEEKSDVRPVEATPSPPVAAAATAITEPNTPSLPWILLMLLLLLLLLFLVRRNRKKASDAKQAL
jgi:MYXO-CTERM domain-containing protein